MLRVRNLTLQIFFLNCTPQNLCMVYLAWGWSVCQKSSSSHFSMWPKASLTERSAWLFTPGLWRAATGGAVGVSHQPGAPLMVATGSSKTALWVWLEVYEVADTGAEIQLVRPEGAQHNTGASAWILSSELWICIMNDSARMQVSPPSSHLGTSHSSHFLLGSVV